MPFRQSTLADKNTAFVANYKYDAWGNITQSSSSVQTGDGLWLDDANPFKYAGYQYDKETYFYYLKSRYYSPFLGRFLTRDNVSRIDEDNLYKYCGNNPISRIDPFGQLWFVVAAGIGGLIGTGIELYGQLKSGKSLKSLDLKRLLVAFVSGAASGALAATGIGVIGTIAANAGIAASASIVNDVVLDNNRNIKTIAGNALVSGVAGAIGGAIGGPGAKYAVKQTGGKLVTNILTGSSKSIPVIYSTARKIIGSSIKTSSAKGAATSILFQAQDVY